MLSRSGVAASCHPSSTPIAIPRDPISAATPMDVQSAIEVTMTAQRPRSGDPIQNQPRLPP